jgi:hypothetical protein
MNKDLELACQQKGGRTSHKLVESIQPVKARVFAFIGAYR